MIKLKTAAIVAVLLHSYCAYTKICENLLSCSHLHGSIPHDEYSLGHSLEQQQQRPRFVVSAIKKLNRLHIHTHIQGAAKKTPLQKLQYLQNGVMFL